MIQVLHHRGPDDSGVEIHEHVGMAFARLSIIDLQHGHQPMVSADGRYAITFNGEIYNFPELRDQLAAKGWEFRTRSDTEVLLTAYAAWGTDVVYQLNGMFAFAIHDRHENTLFMARDRLGIKPLFYCEQGNQFVYGSEIPAVLMHPDVSQDLDAQAMGDYLTYGYTVAPRTIYKDVRELLPGHGLLLSDGLASPEIMSFWSVESQTDVPDTLPEATDALESLLDDAVRMRMVADVPIGALLSGGIDSGLVVAFMSRHSTQPVKTFSVGFAEQTHNELPWAKQVAQKYATDHTEIVCDPNIEELVPRLATAYGQPFADSSAVPTFLVCEEARRHVTVALSGDGGDEGFAGYRRHMASLHRSSLPGLGAVLDPVNRMLPPLARGAQRLRRLALSDREFQVDSLVLTEARIQRRLAGPRLRDGSDPNHSLRLGLDAGGVFELEGGIRRFQHQDLALYLPNDILRKVDIASMMNSLEMRVPLLDHRVVEFGLNLPVNLKNDGVHGKLVLRELARRHLPADHLTKPKTGFAIPHEQWLRGPLKGMLQDSLHRSRLAQEGWLDQSYVKRLLDQHMSGVSRGSILWTVLMLELWFRNRVPARPSVGQEVS